MTRGHIPFAGSPVHMAEHLLAFLLFRIVKAWPVIENPMFLSSEEAEVESHVL